MVAEAEELIKSKKVANYGSVISWPVIGLAGAAGLGIAGYYIAQGLSNFSLGGDIPVLEWGEVREDGTKIGLKELLTGKAEYTFTNPDGSTRTYHNAFAGIPFFGQLVGIGINVAERFKDTAPAWAQPPGWQGHQQTPTTPPMSPAVSQCLKDWYEHQDEDRYLRCILNAQLANLGR